MVRVGPGPGGAPREPDDLNLAIKCHFRTSELRPAGMKPYLPRRCHSDSSTAKVGCNTLHSR